MNVTIAGRGVEKYTDTELVSWLRDRAGQYRVRKPTAELWAAVLRAFDEAGPPMTVRQCYYALVSRGTVAKTERDYKRTCYYLLQMRRRGVLPYEWVADSTRWMRKPDTYSSLEAYLKHGQEAYRRAVWDNQAAYVEVWCEKDALAGVLHQVTAPWDVPLMVTRGFPSESFVYESAQMLKAQRKPVHLYYFGDWDPSGRAIAQNTQDKLRDFGAQFHFEVVAIQEWQIQAWDLPTRPTKRTDSRAKHWRGGSVELDAIPVLRLRELAEAVILRHLDQKSYDDLQEAETAERQAFDQVVANFGLVQELA